MDMFSVVSLVSLLVSILSSIVAFRLHIGHLLPWEGRTSAQSAHRHMCLQGYTAIILEREEEGGTKGVREGGREEGREGGWEERLREKEM